MDYLGSGLNIIKHDFISWRSGKSSISPFGGFLVLEPSPYPPQSKKGQNKKNVDLIVFLSLSSTVAIWR